MMETEFLDAGASGLTGAQKERAIALLRRGEVVAMPTETVYGLAADALRPDAVAKLFEAKDRPLFDPLIVHVPTRASLEELVAIPEESRGLVDALTERFWPGPLTLVLPRRKTVPDIVTAGLDTVAIRMSAHPVFGAVISHFAKPLAAPSANRFGRVSPTTAAHVMNELSGRIPLIVDGGPTQYGLESTIIAVEGGSLRLLRAGPVTTDELKQFARLVTREGGPESRAEMKVEAPGQLTRHYAPETELVLLKELGESWRLAPRFNALEASARVGLLAWRATRADWRYERLEILSPSGDLREAAATLFAKLRRLDEAHLDLIIAEPVPEQGLGIAIMDRLRKGAAHG